MKGECFVNRKKMDCRAVEKIILGFKKTKSGISEVLGGKV